MTRHLTKIALLLLLISRLTGIGACSQPDSARLNQADPTNIECWHYYNGVQRESFGKLVVTFNETVGRQQGIRVQDVSQGNVASLTEKVLAAAASTSGKDRSAGMPNIFAAYADTAYDLARQGRLVALDKYLAGNGLTDFQPDFLASGRFLNEQGLYILPFAKSSEAVVLNAGAWEKFAAANPRFADATACLATWESIGQAAEAYRSWSGKAMFGFDDLANFFIVGCRQLGVDLLQTHNGKGSINFDHDALHRIWSIYYVNTVQGGFAAVSDYRSEDLAQGNLIAGVMSTASGSWLPEQMKLQVLPYPVFRDGQPVCVQQGAGMAVIHTTASQDAAAAIFLAWLTRPEQNVDFTVNAGYLPVTKPALQSQLLRDRLGSLGQSGTALCLNAFLNQMQSSRLYYPEAFSGSYDVRKLLAKSLADLAAESRKSWLTGQAEGRSTEKLQNLYINEVIFEKWYSQLVLDIGRLLDQN